MGEMAGAAGSITIFHAIVGRQRVRTTQWSTFAARALFVGRMVVGGLFAWASVPKVLEPNSFLLSVQQYGLLGPHSTSIVAATVPGLELLLAVFLLMGVAIRGALLASSLLF